ncbi:hypothetical protein D3C85_1831310 [compost metagenome]
MSSNSFSVQNRTLIALLVYLQWCIYEEWYAVTGVQPEDAILDLTFLNREVRFSDRIILIIPNPLQDAWCLYRDGHEAP